MLSHLWWWDSSAPFLHASTTFTVPQCICINLVNNWHEDRQIPLKCANSCTHVRIIKCNVKKYEPMVQRKKKKKRHTKKKIPTGVSSKSKLWAGCMGNQPSYVKDVIIIDYLRLVSYDALTGRFFHQFIREQGMLGRVRLLGFGNEQTHFLVCSPPLRVQLTVVAEWYLKKTEVQHYTSTFPSENVCFTVIMDGNSFFFYQSPKDVDGEEGNGEGNEAHSLQPAPQLKMILSAPQAKPARNSC